MASKKKEVQLQTVISNQEEWNEMLKSDGLTVIDVHQAWCGPCKAVLTLFRKLRSDLESDILHFAVAAADNIESLKIFKGKSEPVFLFCAVKEVNLQPEEPEEPVKRKPTEEPGITDEPYIIAIIKPDAVADGKIESIREKIQQTGHIFKAEEIMTLTEEQVRNIYLESTEEADIEDLVRFMSDGPFCAVIISQEHKPAPELKGLTEPEAALHEIDDIEQKKLGLQDNIITDEMVKICYSEDNKEEANRLRAAFFPRLYKYDKIKEVERTLAIIRPVLLKERKDAVLEKIKQNGYVIEMQKELTLTKDQTHEFYKQHEEQDFFPAFVEHMTSGPVLLLALSRENAVQHWIQLLGPKDVQEAKENNATSLRAEFAVDDMPINQLHGSSSLHRAMEELEFFFPVEQTFAIIKPDACKGYKDDIMHRIKEAGFTVSDMKEINLTHEKASQFYKNHEEKPYFNELVDYMLEGPSMIMTLSKINAVEEWRNLMGPTDPELAKQTSPNSLRAQFAKSILKNAVHGSSHTKHAIESIELFSKEITAEEDQNTARGEDQLISEEEKGGEEVQATGTEDQPVVAEDQPIEDQPVVDEDQPVIDEEQDQLSVVDKDQPDDNIEDQSAIAEADQTDATGEDQPAVADEG
uniref:Thioredoxin domain-containing protein 3 isoform X2 n=1 Tax=Geotrypetes seraphini TaxID=260995 RepID=A0A6P8PAD8_GEOSA|nr:thioredoxin domain-containing protein 3 isoform X2 [Geotrypetes seraphini]